MKSDVVKKATTVNSFVLHTLQGNITHLAVITRKTNIKSGNLKGRNWKRAEYYYSHLASLSIFLKYCKDFIRSCIRTEVDPNVVRTDRSAAESYRSCYKKHADKSLYCFFIRKSLQML